jgi:hypothetical protein
MVNNCGVGKGKGARSAEMYEPASLNFSSFTFIAECA